MKTELPTVYSDPWKSKESSVAFITVIDGDDPNNRPGQKLEETENIKVVRMRIDEDLMTRVVEYCKKNNLNMEAKVYSLCMGIWVRQNLGSLLE